MVIKKHCTGKRAYLFDTVDKGIFSAKAAGPLALLSVVDFIGAFGSALVPPKQNQHIQSPAAVRLTARN